MGWGLNEVDMAAGRARLSQGRDSGAGATRSRIIGVVGVWTWLIRSGDGGVGPGFALVRYGGLGLGSHVR